MSRKMLAAAVVSGGLLVGGLTGVALGVPGIASADDDAAHVEGHDVEGHGRGPGGALDALVSDGVITQEQADAIRSRMEEGRPPRGEMHDAEGAPGMGPEGMRPPAGHGPRGDHRGPGLDEAAKALGLTADELRDELVDGKSIADVAKDRGVNIDAVIDAMVQDVRDRIEEMVNEAPGAHGFGGAKPGN